LPYSLRGRIVMPYKPKKPCAYRGCGKLTDTRYCDAHLAQYKKIKWKNTDRNRPNSTQRGYTSTRYRKARQGFLAKHPLCVECEKDGRTTGATVLDHVKPHRGNYELFWDSSNWQSLCIPCHNRKSQTEIINPFGSVPLSAGKVSGKN
jgi:5-methylcytosine-specific restriction protein A